MKLKTEWIKQGFIDEPITEGIDLQKEIRRMAEEKNAVILAHYYTKGEIQEIADFIGDSLALAVIRSYIIGWLKRPNRSKAEGRQRKTSQI